MSSLHMKTLAKLHILIKSNKCLMKLNNLETFSYPYPIFMKAKFLNNKSARLKKNLADLSDFSVL